MTHKRKKRKKKHLSSLFSVQRNETADVTSLTMGATIKRNGVCCQTSKDTVLVLTLFSKAQNIPHTFH